MAQTRPLVGHIGETRSDWGPDPETATAAPDAFQSATIEVMTDTATGILRQAEIFAQGRLIKPQMQTWVRSKQGIPKW